MTDYMPLHQLNIAIHVITGVCALFLGSLILCLKKGTSSHKTLGRFALGLGLVCTLSGLIGALFFRGRVDLLGVSLLVTYNLWSGVRSLRLANRGRTLPDIVPAVLLAFGGGVLIAGPTFGWAYIWPKAFVIATAGGMLFYGGWDLLRTLFPLSWRRILNPVEHSFKMISLIGALASVAAVNLFDHLVGPVILALSVSAASVALSGLFIIRLVLRLRR